ncbi:MAG: polymerase primary sigma factor, partial [Pseudonocardiales bacterium]|nr:polymerase primary sigma factor [Pseudonocardiales bacterium]
MAPSESSEQPQVSAAATASRAVTKTVDAPAKKAPAKKAPAKKAPAKKAAAKGAPAPDVADAAVADPAIEAEPTDIPPGVELEEIPIDVEADAETEETPEPPEAESSEFTWDEEESEALRQARKDAEMTASADSVRAYLKQIGKVALL